MAITPVQKRNVSMRVQKLLVDEIHGQFLDLYAATVSLSERHPEQVNNELRNALTHMARAVASEDFDHAIAEIKKAEGHIERAKRDAAKISVIELHNLVADASAEIKYLDGTIDAAFLVRRDIITKKRKSLLKNEAKGVPVINDLVALYLEADQLHDDLLKQLNNSGRRLPRWRYRVIAWRRYILGGIGGLIVGIVGSAVYSALAPDGQAFGNSIRHLVGISPVPSSPQPTPANVGGKASGVDKTAKGRVAIAPVKSQ